MLDRAKARTLPIVNQATDLAPAAQACCGVCRTCTTTNVFVLAFAAIGGLGVYLSRLVRPFANPS